MAEVRTSSQSERPCAGIEETRKPPGDAGGSSSPVNGDDHTGKRLAGKPHEPFERADGGRAKARPPPTLHCHKAMRKSYSELGFRRRRSAPSAMACGRSKAYRPRKLTCLKRSGETLAMSVSLMSQPSRLSWSMAAWM